MIEKIIAYSARNKYLVVLLTLVSVLAAVYCMKHVPLDAIPDLSDTQVIVYSRWDRSPDIIEDQVTYPIVTALLGTPRIKTIRGFSDFGFSYVYVIFQDGTDSYWARSRVLEYLSKIQSKLPEGVKTELGPDATGVGWVYQYALVDKTGQHDLASLRSFQDWTLRYWLQAVPGVSEVASIGGFQKQYQVNVDPNALASYNISLTKVVEAVRQGNNDVGGRLVEFSGAEYMVRGRGYAKSVRDIENIVVGKSMNGTPVLVRNIAQVALGPDIRRGVSDLDGEGDTVGGIVIMRHGENALNVIRRIKEKIKEITPSLPNGVEIVTTYDRSGLIEQAIETLKHELIVEMIIVSLVILFFLWHIPSATIPIITIPVSVVLAFIPMYFLGVTTNIMSLAGIAISIGVLVDGAIVEVENAYKRLEEWNEAGRPGDFHEVRLKSLQEVGPSVFFSLLVIAVAFMPVFTLVDQEGRLFKPLAYTKNLAMAIAAVLAVTLDPAIRMMFARMDPYLFKPKWLSSVVNAMVVGKYYPEEKHPVSRVLFRIYEPICLWTLRHKKKVVSVGAFFGLWAVWNLIAIFANVRLPGTLVRGYEFMPPLYEGNLLYMPTTLPGISVTEAQKLMQAQDQILMSFPEVERVFGKAGRAETATDPAPFSMMETTVLLKPKEMWRKGMTKDLLIDEMDKALRFPGVTNAWTMPIKNRIDMLSTGIRTPVGIKVMGSDLEQLEKIGLQLEGVLRDVKGTRSVFAERAAGGYFLDFTLRRDALARHGLSIDDVNMILMSAIGGETVTTTVEGRERYTVSVRYARELRDNLSKLRRVLVPTMSGAHLPLNELADIELKTGPSMIRNENGLLASYVYIDVVGRDIGGYVNEAKALVARQLQIPSGTSLVWSGQYENMLRVRERLNIVLPITLFLIWMLIYMNTKSGFKTAMVLLAVPFSAIGAVIFLYLLNYNISIAVWVGIIALLGLDAETGVFMLLFLDLSYDEAVQKGRMKNQDDLRSAVIHGAVKRIRPKMMTVCAAMMGLVPIMFSMGAGSDMMKRVVAPMIGGLVTSFILELLIYPPIYAMWREKELKMPSS
ncbi:MAG: Cation efflux system protein CusA [Elusimicrobia bacterium]|nr:Cation efflux system protein CusA [Elusimicrobiota bacterium]